MGECRFVRRLRSASRQWLVCAKTCCRLRSTTTQVQEQVVPRPGIRFSRVRAGLQAKREQGRIEVAGRRLLRRRWPCTDLGELALVSVAFAVGGRPRPFAGNSGQSPGSHLSKTRRRQSRRKGSNWRVLGELQGDLHRNRQPSSAARSRRCGSHHRRRTSRRPSISARKLSRLDLGWRVHPGLVLVRRLRRHQQQQQQPDRRCLRWVLPLRQAGKEMRVHAAHLQGLPALAARMLVPERCRAVRVHLIQACCHGQRPSRRRPRWLDALVAGETGGKPGRSPRIEKSDLAPKFQGSGRRTLPGSVAQAPVRHRQQLAVGRVLSIKQQRVRKRGFWFSVRRRRRFLRELVFGALRRRPLATAGLGLVRPVLRRPRPLDVLPDRGNGVRHVRRPPDRGRRGRRSAVPHRRGAERCRKRRRCGRGAPGRAAFERRQPKRRRRLVARFPRRAWFAPQRRQQTGHDSRRVRDRERRVEDISAHWQHVASDIRHSARGRHLQRKASVEPVSSSATVLADSL